VQYGAAGENVSLKEFCCQHFSFFIQCGNASDNHGGPIVGVRIDDADAHSHTISEKARYSTLPVRTSELEW